MRPRPTPLDERLNDPRWTRDIDPKLTVLMTQRLIGQAEADRIIELFHQDPDAAITEAERLYHDLYVKKSPLYEGE